MSPLPVKTKKKLLGQILIEHNLITEDQLRIGLEEQKRTGKFLGRTLVDLHFIDEKILRKVLSIQSGIETIKLKDYEISPGVIKKFPAALAKTYQAIPLKLEDKTLTIAVGDALNVSAHDDLSFILGYKIKILLADSAEINGIIEKYYGADTTSIEDLMKWFDKGAPAVSEITTGAAAGGELANITTLEEIASQAPVISLFNLVLVQTVKDYATDLHLEPFENDFRVRYRVDGMLYDLLHPSPDLAFALFCRFKIMAGMDIAERRVPQDGRIELAIGGREVDLRVNTIPTVFGECLSVRVLDRGKSVLELEHVGLLESDIAKAEKIIKNPQGIILATGPTGCGKTTTLYALLRKLNSVDVKIITTEDPVEYLLDGAVQIPINAKIGLTFGSTLRHILRQDPDIILVGEMRDLETIHAALTAAETGHLVLASLHT
ncbi:MAG: Flp pilus assembly complex ATPase component TadA, partial [Candidatus Omnitrophica bacterium]|nr:Flp pilus assembly complex ATPase component TadA [Candidatus Omnitrophota bacterium]